MPIVNTDKPTPSVVNQTKISGAETWATIPTTWSGESRSWLDCVSLFVNGSLENVTYLWAFNSQPWDYLLPWQVSTGITNIPKP